MDDVRGQRAEMAGLLTQLMSKQEERRAELEEAARMIEQQCEDELVSLADFTSGVIRRVSSFKISRKFKP